MSPAPMTVGVLVLMALRVASSVAGTERPPIIDVHQHAHGMRYLPDGSPPPRLCVNDPVECDNPPSKYTTADGLLEGTLEYMRRYNIVRAVVTSHNPTELAKWQDAAPQRFIGGRSWGSAETTPSLEELRKGFQSGLYGVLGEIGTQYSGVAPDAAELEPYFALAEELDVTVLVHTAGIGARVPTFKVAAGNPLLLEPVLKHHPQLRLYVENAGYPFGDEMIAMLYMYPNLYADISTITWIVPRTAFHNYLRRLLTAGFGQRLMFGSDQMIWPETIGLAVEAIEAADFLTEQQRRDIFFNNAVRFFGFDVEELRESSW